MTAWHQGWLPSAVPGYCGSNLACNCQYVVSRNVHCLLHCQEFHDRTHILGQFHACSASDGMLQLAEPQLKQNL
eukprot:6179952-Pleurochrysis_carterae.AAC.1